MDSPRGPRWFRRLRARLAGGLAVWHHPAYRLPVTTMEARLGLDPRRAELALAWLRREHALRARDVRTPERVSFDDLARVHTPELLDRLTRPEELGRIFGLDAWDIDVDAVMDSIRYACGGTLAAARHAVATGEATLNLLGGFHHAGRAFAGGHCAVNDIAVAVAVLRAEGFTGRVNVLDLDAHPPDGTVDALRDDPGAWIGSISGSDWGAIQGGDEVLLPSGTGDAEYLAALHGLLGRAPKAELTFVLAGGDVLADDRFGRFALTLAGVRSRDRAVAASLHAGSVWLPAGGYRTDAWKVLAGTGLVLAWDDERPIPADADPLRERFAILASRIPREALGNPGSDLADIEVELGLRRRTDGRLLGFYTASGIELALQRYGLLGVLSRLGYGNFRIVIDANDVGERFRLFGSAAGTEHLLDEMVVERRTWEGEPILYVHWLTLRHPLGAFRAGRAPLPGQEVPGLGLAREAGEILALMATRLGLAGVALRPAHFHVAYAARYRTQFADPARQGRFEALLRDTHGQDPGGVSRALGEGRVRMDGAPYAWEPELMVEWIDRSRMTNPARTAQVAAERDAHHFTITPP